MSQDGGKSQDETTKLRLSQDEAMSQDERKSQGKPMDDPDFFDSHTLRELKSETEAACKAVAGAQHEVFKNKKTNGSMEALQRLETQEDMRRGLGQKFIRKVLHAPAFEYFMGSIIVGNIVVMIIELDRTAMEALTGRVHWTEIFGWIVLFIFFVELILRLGAFGRAFWVDPWNIFDFIIVFTDAAAFLIALAAEGVFPVTVLRIFRLAKLARASKVLRVFPELRLLLASLLSSISAIFWGAVLLGLVLLVWSMVAVLFIHPVNQDVSYDGCERCPRAYSSVMQSALTLWQQIIACDEWGQNLIPIIEKHPSTALFFVPLFLSLGLAVVNLILGMVVSVAQEAKNHFKAMDDAQARCVKLESQSNLLKLCRMMDVDNSGELSYDELHQGFESPGAFQDSMESLNITRDDFAVVWAMMDPDNTGSVSYKRLVSRLYRIQTSNSEFTLAYLKYHITLIKHLLTQMHVDQIEQSMKIKHKFTEDLGRVENKEDMVLERQDQCFEMLEAFADAQERDRKAQEKGEEHLPDKLQAAACDASEREDKAHASNGMAPGQEASGGAEGDDPQLQILLEKLFLVLEKEYKPRAKEEEKAVEVLEAVKSKEFQSGEQTNNTLGGERQRASTSLLDSARTATTCETSASISDDTQVWLKKVCCDIEEMRLELKSMLMNVDHKLGSTLHPLSARGSLSAMEQDVLNTEAQLGLLVVPEKAASCNLLSKDFCNAVRQPEHRSTA